MMRQAIEQMETELAEANGKIASLETQLAERWGELVATRATNEELRTWAEHLNELRGNLEQAARTALTVLQDALQKGIPPQVDGNRRAELREALAAAVRGEEESDEKLAAERADHAKTTEGLRIFGEAFAIQQRLTATAEDDLKRLKRAWAANVLQSMAGSGCGSPQDWLPSVLPLLPKAVGELVQAHASHTLGHCAACGKFAPLMARLPLHFRRDDREPPAGHECAWGCL